MLWKSYKLKNEKKKKTKKDRQILNALYIVDRIVFGLFIDLSIPTYEAKWKLLNRPTKLKIFQLASLKHPLYG